MGLDGSPCNLSACGPTRNSQDCVHHLNWYERSVPPVGAQYEEPEQRRHESYLSEMRTSRLLWLLVFVPVVLAGELLSPERHTLLFLLSGSRPRSPGSPPERATESVAERTGDAVGGLLNATLGNLTELLSR